MISEALKVCKSIKPILVFNSHEFYTVKMDVIKQTLRIFCGLLDINSCFDSVKIFITQTDKSKTQTQLKKQYETKLESLKKFFKNEF